MESGRSRGAYKRPNTMAATTANAMQVVTKPSVRVTGAVVFTAGLVQK